MPHQLGPRRSVIDGRQGIGGIVGGLILAAVINTDGKMEQCTLIIGIVQWFTCWCLVGWIWAIWWGWLIYKKQAGK